MTRWREWWRGASVIVVGCLVVLSAVIASAPARALASSTQESVFMDDNLLLYRGDRVADATLERLAGLGVDRVRVTVQWRALAPDPGSGVRPASLRDPTDPAGYRADAFAPYDHLLRVIRQLGLGVIFNVTGGAPDWATGRLHGHRVGPYYRPAAVAFGQFVQMLGRRYDGTYPSGPHGARLPRVDTWSIWNEPNQASRILPQWVRSGPNGTPAPDSTRARGRWVPYSPIVYRGLARAAIAALRASRHGADAILLGETAPRGVARHGPREAMRPGIFLRALFCLDGGLHVLGGRASRAQGCDYQTAGALAVTGYAHHPYSFIGRAELAPYVSDPNPDDFPLADTSRLVTVLDAAARAGHVPAGLPLWWTEYGYKTDPPNPFAGVTLGQQVRFSAEAEYLTYADPRVAAHTQFLMRDDVPRLHYGPHDRRRWATYQTGLTFATGSPKPYYDAYRLPFLAPSQVAPGAPLPLWGLIRPGGRAATTHRTVQLQFASAGSPTFVNFGPAFTVTGSHGYFAITVMPPGSGTWRFFWLAPPRPPPAPSSQAPSRPARRPSLTPLLGGSSRSDTTPARAPTRPSPPPPPPRPYFSVGLAVIVTGRSGQPRRSDPPRSAFGELSPARTALYTLRP